jgi:predicted aminopeptidase
MTLVMPDTILCDVQAMNDRNLESIKVDAPCRIELGYRMRPTDPRNVLSRNRLPLCSTLLISIMLLPGCVDQSLIDALEYVSHAAAGQSGVVANTESIEAVQASGRLTESELAKLDLAVRARTFAIERMGLSGENAYTTFLDTGDAPLAFNLSAARQDRLEAVTWTFPLVGTLPYLAFFDEDYLREVQQQLIDQGYDTMTYELDAYSTLGVFEDPIRSPMLRRSNISLSDTIIHELLHNTIYRPNNTTFNESLATFVGRTGAIQFLTEEFGADSDIASIANALYADIDTINAFLFEFRAEAEAYYGQSLSSAELVAGREALFERARQRFVDEVQPTLNYPDGYAYYAELPTNNAWLLANFRYNLSLDVFRDVFTAVDESWPDALAVFQAAANAPGYPFDYLENWLAQR